MPHQYFPIEAPGTRGLNTQQKGILDPRYLRYCDNVMINGTGLLGNRPQCKENITGTDFTSNQNFHTIHEYLQADGTSEILINTTGIGGGTFNDLDDPASNVVDGSVSVVKPWWMQNINGYCIAATDGQQLAVYSGSTFATISASSGTVPTSADGIMLCAYGRVWALDSDHQTIKFSALDDHTHWSTGAGQIDMAQIWTQGMDRVTAIVAYNGGLVVFGLRHIVFWVDGQGNQLGIDPDNLYVSEVIEGTGCLHQRSIGTLPTGDVIFLSRHGLQQLSRAFAADRDYATNNLTYLIKDDFVRVMGDTVPADQDLSAAVDPVRGLYVLVHNDSGSDINTWVVQFSYPFVEEISRQVLYPIFKWSSAHASSSFYEWYAVGWDDANQRLLFGNGWEVYSLDEHANATWAGSNGDTTNNAIAFTSYFSPGDPGLIKSLDGMWLAVASSADISPTLSVRYDFEEVVSFLSGLLKTVSLTVPSGTGRATTKVAQFGGRGTFISLGFQLTLGSTTEWGIQAMDLWAKLGGAMRSEVTQ